MDEPSIFYYPLVPEEGECINEIAINWELAVDSDDFNILLKDAYETATIVTALSSLVIKGHLQRDIDGKLVSGFSKDDITEMERALANIRAYKHLLSLKRVKFHNPDVWKQTSSDLKWCEDTLKKMMGEV